MPDASPTAAPPAPRVAAIVLAAGEGRRMGLPKALLPIAGQTFVEHVVAQLDEAAVDAIFVVLGAQAHRVQNSVKLAPARVVLNEAWERGQLSSLQAGLRALEPGRYAAVLMALVDHPLLEPAVVRAVVAAFRSTDRPIVLPVHAGRRGHPVLFAARLIPELLAAPEDQGARAVVRAHAAEVLEVPVTAQGVVADIDTPALYERWLGAPSPVRPSAQPPV